MSVFNVYCDESCYLEHDKCDVMVIGGIYVPKEKVQEIHSRIKDLRLKHYIRRNQEFKWTGVSEAKKDFYKDVLNYFFDNNDMHFRAIIADKTRLNHESHNQSHDEWYYKIYFRMLQNILNNANEYNIYIDIKEKKRGGRKARILEEYLANSKYDFDRRVLKSLQIIDSNDSTILQICDLLIGALGYHNRKDIEKQNNAKLELVSLIKRRSGLTLDRSTFLSEKKFNIFIWDGQK